MTPEQQQQIEQKAKAANGYTVFGNGDKSRCFNKGYISAATKYLSIIEEKDMEIERLMAWKDEAMELLTPLLEYGKRHKDIPLGGKITEHILMWAKQYHEQRAEIVRLIADRDRLQKLLMLNDR